MDEWIRNYIPSCDTCQRNKSSRHAKYGLLQPLDTPYAPWRSISVDFIVALPESEGKNQIMVVVDRFTKMGHFIPLIGESSAKNCADAFLQNVWKLHGLPDEIISDQDTKWTSQFWNELCEIMGIKRNLSTAFHPQSDGQTERLNQTLEQYLRTFINYDQDDWVQLLPLAEYAYNNSVTALTKMSPFYANYGYNSRTNWAKEVEVKNPASTLYAHWMESVHTKARENLEKARKAMWNYYDQKRMEAPSFKEGDLVMLDGRNIRTKRPSKKLAPKKYGPFKILKKIGTRAYKLELHSRWRIHDVFHVSLLEPYIRRELEGRVQTRPEPEEINGDLEYEVEGIINSEIRNSTKKINGRNKRVKTQFYLVKWKGYPEDECTWEPGHHLTSAEEKVEEFHQNNPQAPTLRKTT